MNKDVIDPPGEELAALAAQINAEHAAGERAARRGMAHFRAAGLALLKAKAACGHGRWLPWLKANVQCSQRRAQRYMALAKCEAASDLEDQWRVISGHGAHVGNNSGEHEWYTPPEFVDAARAVLGAIDVDPASAERAQETVRAGTYYTKEDDGLSRPWAGRLWLNPPYEKKLVDAFTEKLVNHYRAGDVTEAVVLVNNATDTEWFCRLAAAASAACFPSRRIKFLRPEGEDGAPLQGQALLYLGGDVGAFRAAFGKFGRVWRPDDHA
jgi:ParB family chromosome partitioning protein